MFRVLAVYVAVALGVLQAASLTFGPLHLPSWALTLVVVLALLGLPVTAVIAWAFETTPEGVRATPGGADGSWAHAGLLVIGTVGLTIAAVFGARAWLGASALPFLGGGAAGADGPASAGAGTSATTASSGGSSSAIRLAVLPLENRSADPKNAYFAGGLSDELTTALSRVPGFTVTSQVSASRFAGSEATAPRIADSLGVRYLLTGSASLDGGTGAISARLVDGRGDSTIWTHRFERPAGDIRDLQLDVARRIAELLRSRFTRTEEKRILAGQTRDPVAHDLYLREQNLGPYGPPDSATAERQIELLRRALARDSTFAAAWYALALTFPDARPSGDWVDTTRLAYDRAVRWASAPALRAQYRSVEAYALGRDPDSALTATREAVEANPGNAQLVFALAQAYRGLGDLPDAVSWGRRARALDPLNPSRWGFVGGCYEGLGMERKAERAYRKQIELDRTDAAGWSALELLLARQGRYSEASALEDSLVAETGDPEELSDRGFLALWRGDAVRGHRLLERALRTRSWADEVRHVPEIVRARELAGDTAGTGSLVRRAEASLRASAFGGDPAVLVEMAAVQDHGREAARRLRAYIERGGYTPLGLLTDDPDFGPVRSDTAFQAAVREARAVVQRQRREVRRTLASEDGG